MSDASRIYATDEALLGEGAAALDSPPPRSVGGALRWARERRGLSLAQMGRELCLKEDTLRALESRQYGRLPKVPYCYGFVRTYARALGLDAEDIVRRFKAELGDVPKPAKLVPPQPLRTGRFAARSMVGLSVLIAAAAYAGWYFYTAEPGTALAPQAALPQAGMPQAGAPQTGSPQAGSPQAGAPQRAADAHAPAPGSAETETAGRLDAAPADRKTGPEGEASRHGATTSAAPPGTVSPAPAAPGVASPGAVPQSPPPAAAADTAGIVIRTTAPCWVYVHDMKGRVLFHKTLQKGDEYALPADAKGFVVDLGNAQGAEIVVNGRVLKPLSVLPGRALRINLDIKELEKLP